MKSESHIRQQFKQVLFRRRKIAIQEALEVTSTNCAHHRMEKRIRANASLHSLPVISFGVCSLQGEVDRPVCDKMVGDLAKSCPHYKSACSVEEVKSFYKGISKMSPQELIKLGFPDLAALAWVLREESGERILLDDVEDLEEPEVLPEAETSASSKESESPLVFSSIGSKEGKDVGSFWERFKKWVRSWF